MNRAYKFRMYPNAEQAVMFGKIFGCVRFIYNKMLEDRLTQYKLTGEAKGVTPAKYKKEFAFLKEADSLALANAQLNLEAAYKNFFRGGGAGFPNFKSKKNSRDSYKTNRVKNNIRLSGGFITLPKVGAVKLKRHREIPEDYVLKSVTVSRTPSGKYYASVLFEYERAVEPVEIKKAIGLNYSAAGLYTDSEGGNAQYGQKYRRSLQKLKKMSRALSKMKKSGKNWYKQKRRIALEYEKAANRRMDFLHKQSRQIANAYDLVGLENMNAGARGSGKAAEDKSWGIFRMLLKYKLEEQGKYFVRTDKQADAVNIRDEAVRMVTV